MNGRVDCTCPTVQHEHGTHLAYNADRCRCEPCRAAKVKWQRDFRRKRAQQKWSGQPDIIPADGSRRRMQALCANGWSLRSLSREMGITRRAVGYAREDTYRFVHRDYARGIADLYDRLWNVHPSGPGGDQARRYARQRGWLPPLAWDDDTIDMPTVLHEIGKTEITDLDGELTHDFIDEIAVDQAVGGRRVALTKAEWSAATAILSGMGYSTNQIAERLGTCQRRVQRIRARTAA